MKTSPITKKIMERIGLIAIIIIAVTFVLSLFVDSLTFLAAVLFSIGVFITSTVNCFRIYMIGRTAEKLLTMDNPTYGKGYAFLMSFVRYALTIVVVGIVILIMFLITGDSPFISFETDSSPYYPPMIIGLVVGLFTMKIGVITSKKILEEDTNETNDTTID
jgi:lysylphosphatidylglycerol synthetase-like protein (DUF2156 family)